MLNAFDKNNLKLALFQQDVLTSRFDHPRRNTDFSAGLVHVWIALLAVV